MNILNTLMQLFGGDCAGGACAVPAAATEATNALGGISGLWGLLCQLFGLGC